MLGLSSILVAEQAHCLTHALQVSHSPLERCGMCCMGDASSGHLSLLPYTTRQALKNLNGLLFSGMVFALPLVKHCTNGSSGRVLAPTERVGSLLSVQASSRLLWVQATSRRHGILRTVSGTQSSVSWQSAQSCCCTAPSLSSWATCGRALCATSTLTWSAEIPSSPSLQPQLGTDSLCSSQLSAAYTGNPALSRGHLTHCLPRHSTQSAHSALCRSRANALSAFQEGVQALAVRSTPWDVQQPVSDIAVEIDAHISKMRAQKVILPAYTLSRCSSIY